MAPEPTDEQLQRAWRELSREGWAPVAELRTSHMRYQLVRARAIALAFGRGAPAAIAPSPRPAPARAPLHVPHADPILDNKRRAAGEREDD